MSKPLISIQNLKISRSNRILLNRVDISIHEFDRIVLVGDNGCGKSSLLRTLERTDKIDDGIVWLSPNLKLYYLDQDPPEPSIFDLIEFLSREKARILSVIFNFSNSIELKYE